jgi:transposase-like protein
MRKLTEDQKKDICELAAQGMSYRDIARQYG